MQPARADSGLKGHFVCVTQLQLTLETTEILEISL